MKRLRPYRRHRQSVQSVADIFKESKSQEHSQQQQTNICIDDVSACCCRRRWLTQQNKHQRWNHLLHSPFSQVEVHCTEQLTVYVTSCFIRYAATSLALHCITRLNHMNCQELNNPCSLRDSNIVLLRNTFVLSAGSEYIRRFLCGQEGELNSPDHLNMQELETTLPSSGIPLWGNEPQVGRVFEGRVINLGSLY